MLKLDAKLKAKPLVKPLKVRQSHAKEARKVWRTHEDVGEQRAQRASAGRHRGLHGEPPGLQLCATALQFLENCSSFEAFSTVFNCF